MAQGQNVIKTGKVGRVATRRRSNFRRFTLRLASHAVAGCCLLDCKNLDEVIEWGKCSTSFRTPPSVKRANSIVGRSAEKYGVAAMGSKRQRL